MTRKPNSTTTRTPAGLTVVFLGHEIRMLKRNVPPNGDRNKLGGMQNLENWLLNNTDPVTLVCHLTPRELEMWIRYIQRYARGGPNQRLRDVGYPLLRRYGIELQPGWASPASRPGDGKPVPIATENMNPHPKMEMR